MRLFEGTPWDRSPSCERCGVLEEDCCCPPPPKVFAAPEIQTARLAVEKRKKGKLFDFGGVNKCMKKELDRYIEKLEN